MRVLSRGASFLPGPAEEERFELVGEGGGGWSAEVVGDGDGSGGRAGVAGRDPFGWPPVVACVGVVDLDGDPAAAA
jgi:hypothetical protein